LPMDNYGVRVLALFFTRLDGCRQLISYPIWGVACIVGGALTS